MTLLAESRYEFINFGVENYGLQEIIATARYKALRYDPDLILFAMTRAHRTFVGHLTRCRLCHCQTGIAPGIRFCCSRLQDFWVFPPGDSTELQGYVDVVRPTEHGVVSRQVARALVELGELGRANKIPVVAAWIRLAPDDETRLGPVFLDRAAKQGIAGVVVDLQKLLQPGEDKQKLLVSRVEPHPNAYGHKLIAAELQRQLFANNPLFAIP